jgi:curved DNA-binding protein CbpA
MAQQVAVPDHYAVLRVAPSASPDAVKEAFRLAALGTHPDKRQRPSNTSGAAATADAAADADAFVAVQRAWDTLRDPVRRAAYDEQRLAAAVRTFVHPPHAAIAEDDVDVDADTGGLCYRCRCGGVIDLDHAVDAGEGGDGSGGEGSGGATGCGRHARPVVVVTCPSCSLRYSYGASPEGVVPDR